MPRARSKTLKGNSMPKTSKSPKEPSAPKASNTPKGSLAPKGRQISARGKAPGPVTPTNLSPEGAAELPDGWRWMTVEELAADEPRSIVDGPFGSKLKSAHYTEEGPRVIRLQNIGDGEFIDAEAHISEEHFDTLKNHRIYAGDLVIAALGADPPRACLIPESVGPAIVKADCIRFKPAPEHSVKYLMSALNSPGVRKRTKAIVHGVGRPRLNQKEIKAIQLPVAPPDEQRRIVARIEELFSRLDAGVAALRHAKAQLQRYRQSVLAAAVTGQLTQAWREQHPDTEPASQLLERVLAERAEVWAGRGKYKPPVEIDGDLEELPAGWEWTTLAHLANHIADGTHKTPTYVEEGVAFLSAKDVNGFKLSFDACRYIPREEHEELIKRCLPKPGNVLVTKSGTIGRIAVVKTEREFSLFESVANVPVLGDIFSDFIAYAAHVGIAGAFGAKNKKGVAVRHLHLEDLRRLPIPLPPLAEQPQIVAEAEARTTAIDHLEAELDRQITRTNRLRQSTLSSAFSGKL